MKICCICGLLFNSPWPFVKHNTTCPANFLESLGYPKPKTAVYYESVLSSVNATKESDNGSFEFDASLFDIDFDEIRHQKNLTVK